MFCLPSTNDQSNFQIFPINGGSVLSGLLELIMQSPEDGLRRNASLDIQQRAQTGSACPLPCTMINTFYMWEVEDQNHKRQKSEGEVSFTNLT